MLCVSRNAIEHRLKTKKFGTRHQRVDGSVLQGNADAAANCIGLGLDVIARNRSRACAWLQQGGEDADGGAFAGAVWAKKTEYFTSGDFKVDTVNGTDFVFTTSEGTHEVRGDDGGLQRGHGVQATSSLSGVLAAV